MLYYNVQTQQLTIIIIVGLLTTEQQQAVTQDSNCMYTVNHKKVAVHL